MTKLRVPSLGLTLGIFMIASCAAAGPAENCASKSESKDPDLRISGCTAYIRQHPRDVSAYLYRALGYAQKRKYGLAIADCNTAIKMDPGRIAAYGIRGDAYERLAPLIASLKSDYLIAAIADYKKAISLTPRTDPRDPRKAGEDQFYQKLAAERLAALERSSTVEAGFEPCWEEEAKDLDLKISSCTAYIRQYPDEAEGYLHRSVAHLSKGNYDLAIADCNTVIKMEPGRLSAYTVRGEAYENGGGGGLPSVYLGRATSDYKKAISLAATGHAEEDKYYRNLAAERLAALEDSSKAARSIMRGFETLFGDDVTKQLPDERPTGTKDPAPAECSGKKSVVNELLGECPSK